MTPETNQFLNDCCTALREVRGNFTMTVYFRGTPEPHGCGSPACVLGHYVAWKEFPAESRRLMANRLHVGEGLGRGLSACERAELFHEDGCAGARTAQEAIAYIEDFILRHGGTVQPWIDPAVKKLVTSLRTKEVVHEPA